MSLSLRLRFFVVQNDLCVAELIDYFFLYNDKIRKLLHKHNKIVHHTCKSCDHTLDSFQPKICISSTI